MENQFSRPLQEDIVILLHLDFVMEKGAPQLPNAPSPWKDQGLSLTAHGDPEADRKTTRSVPHTNVALNARSVPGFPVPLNREYTCIGGSQLKIQIASKQSPNNKAEIH